MFKLTMVSINAGLVLQGICKKTFCKVPRASHAVATLVEKDPQRCEFVCTLFGTEQSLAAPTNGSQFLQTDLSSASRGAFATSDIETHSIFSVQRLFQIIKILWKEIKTKAPKFIRSRLAGTPIG